MVKRWLSRGGAWLMAGLVALDRAPRALPRVIRCIVHERTKNPHATVVGGGRIASIGWLRVAVAALALLVVPLVTGLADGALLAITAAASTRKLPDILKELKDLQEKYRGKPMPKEEGEKFDALAREAKEMQDEVDREARIKEVEDFSKRVPDATLPDDHQPDHEGKDRKEGFEFPRNRIAGYMQLGDFAVAQKAYNDFRSAGKPKAAWMLAKFEDVPMLRRVSGMRQPIIPLSHDQIKALVETKAVPNLGESVIEPDRLPEIVRVTEHDRLVLRDVLDIQRTTSDAVKYTRIVNYTRAASAVAHSAPKPEAALALDTRTEPVKTIAVWIPVEEQQLDDYPALAGIINGELLFDVDKHVEELVMYGDGDGENFRGILTDPNVLAARSVDFGGDGADTLIDVARRGITVIRRAGYEPNGILADPLDWEVIVLVKGTDERYVWVVVTEGATQRLWGVPVIETVAMEDFAGVQTEQRHLLVGDFRRGATLWDRQDSNIQVGWINDQFIRNQRTILAEMRAAFGVKRPGAFRKFQTQAPSES
jgi:HK97 family phage major capsid protein